MSVVGLLPIIALAEKAGLRSLADRWSSVPTDKRANAGAKVASLVAGMVAGADSIDDMAVLRHGGMGKLFTAIYAPSALGSILRSFTFGHFRQLDAVASRFLVALAAEAPIVAAPTVGQMVFVDVDDTIIEVHGPNAYVRLGFDAVGNERFKKLVLARVVEPTSKADTLRVWDECGVPGAPSLSTIWRTLARCVERDWRSKLAMAA